MTSPAEFMVSLVDQLGELRQDDAAWRLQQNFGDTATYYNNVGNLAINPEVLKDFKRLTPDVVWMRSSRFWRKRQSGDQPGRQQPY